MGTVLIVGHAHDEHCDLLESVLAAEASVDVVRIALADLPASPSTWSPEDGWCIGGHQMGRGQIAGLFRRPGNPIVAYYEPRYAAFVDSECRDAFHGALACLDVRWVNSPLVLASAELKLRQLQVAKELDVRIPHTLVTNEPDRATAFLDGHNAVVAKPVRYGLVASDPEPMVAWVRNVQGGELSALEGPPVILQERIDAVMHLRVVTVGDDAFVAALAGVDGVDWREDPPNHQRFQVAKAAVADSVGPMARAISGALGLGYASQDWLVDGAGDLLFLEANPNGQWAFLDGVFEQPITTHVAAQLLRLATA